MITHCLSFIAHLNQLAGFRHGEINATVDGMKGYYIDTENGQEYEVTVKAVDPVDTLLRKI